MTGATYTYLNGLDASGNWTARFEPGKRVRLRLIHGSAMSYFGVLFGRKLGESRDLAREQDEDVSRFSVVFGMHLLF